MRPLMLSAVGLTRARAPSACSMHLDTVGCETPYRAASRLCDTPCFLDSRYMSSLWAGWRCERLPGSASLPGLPWYSGDSGSASIAVLSASRCTSKFSDRTPVTASSATPSSRIESFTIVLHMRTASLGGRPRARSRRLYRSSRRRSRPLSRLFLSLSLFCDDFDTALHGAAAFCSALSDFVHQLAKKC